MTGLDWEKILDKPTKSYKVPGTTILEMRDKIEKRDRQVADLTKTRDSLTEKVNSLEKQVAALESELRDAKAKLPTLEGTVKELENTVSTQKEEINKLNDQVSSQNSKISALDADLSQAKGTSTNQEGEINNLKSQIESLQTSLNEKENTITDMNNALTKRNNTIDELNAKIEELKEQIPKKQVFEKADEVVKGAGCPKCGWTTIEEYKYVGEKKQLIRKYCPNTFCMWVAGAEEAPTIKIAMDEAAPAEAVKEVTVFKIKGSDIEEVKTLNSKMVAIIADTPQEIVWIWKGSESSRFEYAEATSQATRVKNIVALKPHVPVNRVNEGEEPDNFPSIKIEQ